MTPRCPECGAALRPVGRGITRARRGPRYLCPQSEAEEALQAKERGE